MQPTDAPTYPIDQTRVVRIAHLYGLSESDIPHGWGGPRTEALCEAMRQERVPHSTVYRMAIAQELHELLAVRAGRATETERDMLARATKGIQDAALRDDIARHARAWYRRLIAGGTGTYEARDLALESAAERLAASCYPAPPAQVYL